jgi:hypothetical protein
MRPNLLAPRQSINKAYLKVKPNRSQIETFKKNISNLFVQIKQTESEEFHKNIISEFLKNTYYSPNNYINTKGRADLVIHNGKDSNSTVGVLFEIKKPENKSEMPTCENINTKAFHELILYYLRERISNKNIEVKHLIITNIYEWFVFNSNDFEKLFAENKSIVKKFLDFEERRLAGTNTDFFYKSIAEPLCLEIETPIPVTYFDIRDFDNIIKNDNRGDDNKLIALYKIFSPEHLLKLPFANDSNNLDKGFYNELLHIIGLEEVKEGGKKIIQRKNEKSRNAGSLIENSVTILRAEDCLTQIPKLSDYGVDKEEQLFNISLELAITWINRILFLKLLEGQLLKYNNGDPSFKFLNIKRIQGYDELNKLFFQVLAVKETDRSELINVKFRNIPFLNSSLFEATDLEHKTIRISNLDDQIRLPLFSSTVLKDQTGKKLCGEKEPLEYLFEFLDSYDFTSEGSEEIQEENKTLINASVLGLIFEKINGYKDGSFFTPGFITMFMCHEAIQLAVINKFNETKGWNCKTISELYNKIDDVIEANTIINTLRICDPAVGSGHFLVSALNEIIALKSELGILIDRAGKRLKGYSIEVVNDELIISDEESKLFEYNPRNKESQRVQESIFHEKQTIIENCLFGVDLNPNSVKICRLRLWIELLKNSYYKRGESNFELETLPNIDINIKCGNSLISRYSLDVDIKAALKSSKWKVDNYREAVMTYRNAQSKGEKREMEQMISVIKNDFETQVSKNDKRFLKLNKLSGELLGMTSQSSLFELSKSQKDEWNKKVLKLTGEINSLETQISDINRNQIYRNAFEWRFEFPDILNNDGEFVGFDLIIGNPPYIQLQKDGGSLASLTQSGGYSTFERMGDIYSLFYERGWHLLKTKGILCYITSNKWMRAGYGESTRKFFSEKTNPILLVDFAGNKIFDSATVDTNILIFSKEENKETTVSCIVKENMLNNLSVYVKQFGTKCKFNKSESWVILTDIEKRIKEKIEKIGTPLKDWDIQINYGIKTGFNDAFIIDGVKRKELIEQDPKSEEIIRPILRGRDIRRYNYEFADLWLLYVPWHFPLHNDPTIKGVSEKAELAFQSQFPAVYHHLLKFKSELSSRNKSETGIHYEWYALQRWGANYWEDFFQPKIIYPGIMRIAKSNSSNFPRFCFDQKDNFFFGNDCYFIVGNNLDYLWLVLNTSLVGYLFRYYIYSFDETGFKMFTDYFQNIPIPLPNQLTLKQAEIFINGSVNVNEVNAWLYEIIGFTEEEILEIENSHEVIINGSSAL